MANTRKIALIAVGGLLALLLLAAVAMVLFVDANAHKPWLEAVASDALGMEVRIGGRLGVGILPGFHVTLEDVRIRNRGMDVASAKGNSTSKHLGIKTGESRPKRPEGRDSPWT